MAIESVKGGGETTGSRRTAAKLSAMTVGTGCCPVNDGKAAVIGVSVCPIDRMNDKVPVRIKHMARITTYRLPAPLQIPGVTADTAGEIGGGEGSGRMGLEPIQRVSVTIHRRTGIAVGAPGHGEGDNAQ